MIDWEVYEQTTVCAIESLCKCMDEIKEAIEQIVKAFMNSSIIQAMQEEFHELVKQIEKKKPIPRTPYKEKCNTPFQQDKRVRIHRCRNTI